ncbi:MAG: hypothetical protein RL220_2110 [Bacteroidota bacterium]
MDKVAHVIMFLILSHALAVALRKQQTSMLLQRWSMILAVTCAIACGAFLELIQSTVFDERTTDAADFVANSLGALAGPFLFRLIYGNEIYRSASISDRSQSTL